MEKDKAYIQHILDATALIKKFVAGKNYNNFCDDELLQSGIVRELEIIGEAVKRLSDDFKASISILPWRDIAGMRDKLIHDYFSVDLEAVWKAATEDIERLEIEIRKKLN